MRHVSGASELDLMELVRLCDEQLQRMEDGQAVRRVPWPLRTLMRAMTKAAESRMSEQS